jgi:hypothetical protein
MPVGNNFQHSPYSRSDPGGRVNFREFVAGAPPDSLAWQEAMARFGGDMEKAGVRALLFIHGTFLSTDLFGAQRLDEAGGLKRGYSRGIPGVDALLALMREETNGLPGFPGAGKPPYQDDGTPRDVIDKLTEDAANFPSRYVGLIGAAINRSLARPMTCQRLLWSCEHHHLGRALAACLLLEELVQLRARLQLSAGDRILVQAHGQAGLVLALLSNLIGPADAVTLKAFFEVLNAYHRQSHAPSAVGDLLERVHVRLRDGGGLNGVTLDVVTYGCPVRYGWDPSRLGHLLHVVNHRPMRADGKRWLAKMELPQITMEMPLVWGGDYVQQLAVAGTDAVPSTQEGKDANKALWEMLEPYDGFERWLECARKAVRCQADGHCLLVDYKDASLTTALPPKDHIYGHAAYTRTNAILFNTTEIVRRFYSS